ncbi:cytochrome P450 2K1-like isoform X2 [Denticeps clupeoides]|uniref:cytochrome P450 2K1-like isoform X2 n=1 Tax=Denticeps clupeoides TaxID=299321 RepID=UPI0010A44AD9|nr:cytochrome P450 2K1-like isoform X2 [Denticeps clupeoides]
MHSSPSCHPEKASVIFFDMDLLEELLQSPCSLALLSAALLLVCYLLSAGSRTCNHEKEPPGPKPLPFLGNMLLLNLKRIDRSLCELSKEYGPVFTVHLGPLKLVVLTGYKTVKQALVNQAEAFGHREIMPISRDLNNGYGIIFSNGKNWKEMRRFAIATLRDFGLGKKSLEAKVSEEVQHLIAAFEEFKGEAFNMFQPVTYAVSNIICALVYGSRFDYADPKFKDMVSRTNETIKLSGSPSLWIYNTFPWLKWAVPAQWQIMENMRENIGSVKSLIECLQKTLNTSDQRCLVDTFIARMQSDKETGKQDSHFTDYNLLMCVLNLFSAGTDTTATTLRWGLLFMAKYPHIQDRVQEEIEKVIGLRCPVVEDRRNLPYTDAVIHETQRLANIVPMNLPHSTSCDVHFQGYFIKKGTCVIPLLTSVLEDEREWEKPHNFYPEHFLDKEGCFVKRDAFLPFSAGRRACLGEGLAKMELFIFFTTLLQHFRFTPPPGVSEDELDLTPFVGFTLTPSPHKLCAVRRV